jgi:hypothetical protein
MQERRAGVRCRVLKDAKLILGSASVLDCLVHNLTNRGATIDIAYAADLPENLSMTFDGGRTIRQCRLVWRKYNQIGVQFL